MLRKEEDPESATGPDETAESDEMARLHEILHQIQRSTSFGQLLTAGISTPAQYRSRMTTGAREAAATVKNKLTENWVDDSDEEEVISISPLGRTCQRSNMGITWMTF